MQRLKLSWSTEKIRKRLRRCSDVSFEVDVPDLQHNALEGASTVEHVD